MKPDACQECVGAQWQGYMAEPDGTGATGVMLVGEALGEQEAKEGRPFRGAAGLMLAQLLQRGGLKPEQFWIENCVRCRPPQNRLSGEAYEGEVVDYCTALHLRHSIARLKPKAIVALGDLPARHLLGLTEWEPFSISRSRGYVEWSHRYGCWIVPTLHPAFLLRGQTSLCGTVLYDIQHAVQIAERGFAHHEPELLIDPSPMEFEQWVEWTLADRDRQIAYDIETPYKVAHELAGEEDGDVAEDVTFTILRIGFATGLGRAVTIPWDAPYIPAVRRLLASPQVKLVWNSAYDTPRLDANGAPVGGPIWDIMEAWHVVNAALPKRLEFVAPFYAPDQPRWKHTASRDPARYNAIDAEVEWRVGQGVVRDLRQQGGWRLFERHMVTLRTLLDEMSAIGVPVDDGERRQSSGLLSRELERLRVRMQEVVPRAARELKVFKRPVPPEKREVGEWTTVMMDRPTKQCTRCGARDVTQLHVTRKKDNPCHGAEIERRELATVLDALVEPFVPSNSQLLTYLNTKGQKPIFGETKRPTFDDDALDRLVRRYPKDLLYPLVREYRRVEKVLGTYIGVWGETAWQGGMPVGEDGRVHTRYTNNPKTLRLSSQNPNLQNVPRGDDEWSALVKRMFVAEPGCWLVEIDYAAIEAVITGYLAQDRDFLRLAYLGVHDYVNGHNLKRLGKIAEAPDVRWSDADLSACFKELKAHFPQERTQAKRTVYLSLYGGTPNRMMQVDPISFPSLAVARDLQALLWSVFPLVRRWQHETVMKAAKQGYLKTPFGNVLRFWRPVNWVKAGSEWVAEWGEEAKEALAFQPQSIAAGIIKEAMLRIGGDWELRRLLRLTVHDSLVAMVRKDEPYRIKALQQLMEMPNPELPLPGEWEMGSHLAIRTEAKIGDRWGSMERWA